MTSATDRSSHASPAARWPYALVVVALALAAWGALRSAPGDASTPIDPAKVLIPGAAQGFNLLFVTLDTTRVDRLGCYGYADAQTPTINALAARGVRFDDAITSVPVTLPSHSVMMTGKYPPATGVRDNGQTLAEDHVTLAEVLSSNGYETAAFVGAFVLDRRWGISQGFATYDFQSGSQGLISADSLVHERQADSVSRSALQWFKQRRERSDREPFFVWLHYFDPHFPYESPLAALPEFEGRPYDAEIAMVDAQLKRVLDELAGAGELDNTLVVLATDHGEGFYEKDEAYHGIFLYESTVHAALILSNPRLFDRAYRVDDRVVGMVDLVPSILELLAVPAPADLDGRSLRAPRDDQRFVYIETEFPLANGCAALYGLRRHNDKYISAPRSEYYDLARDRQEETNLFDPDSPQVNELYGHLKSMLERWSGIEPTSTPAVSPSDINALHGLGYVGGTTHHGDDLPDPKDHIHTINKITDVLRLKGHGQLEEALALVNEVAAESEGWNVPVLHQAMIYEAMGRLDEAERVLRAYAENFPSDKSYYDYAIVLEKQGRYEDCLNLVDSEVLTRDRKLGAAHLLRGECLIKLQRYPDALAACEEAQRVDPDRLADRLHDCLRTARQHAAP